MKMTTTRKINITFGTDFHFGHRRTPSSLTLRSVINAWPDTPAMSDIDLFIIGGDWMDRQITLSQTDAYDAQEAAVYLLRLCAKHDITLIIVNGTSSHDRNQSIMFVELNERFKIGCNCIYRDTLCIEYIKHLDLYILLVPDELNHDSEITYDQAKQLITKAGLTKVDMAVVHSGFKYQFPIDMPSLFDEAKWSELVVYCILSGHIHNHSQCLKVICGGAFNRNRHDEDTPKGHVNLTLEDGKVAKVKFVVNKLAKVYKSISIQGMDANDVIQAIANLGELPIDSAIRLEYGPDDPIQAIRLIVSSTFKNYYISDIKRVDNNDNRRTSRLFADVIYQPVAITPNSVSAIIMERLINRTDVSPDMLRMCTTIIDEVIEED